MWRLGPKHRPWAPPDRATRGFPMSKIALRLWSVGAAEEAENFSVSRLPDSRIDKIQRTTVDGRSGPAGSVLVVQFTLAGQEYMALNGGMRFEYPPAISFKVDCADRAEVDGR